MPNQTADDEAKLRKLGKRLREGFTKKHPVSEKSIETVRNAVREEWEREQEANRAKRTPPAGTFNRERKPPEPGHDR